MFFSPVIHSLLQISSLQNTLHFTQKCSDELKNLSVNIIHIHHTEFNDGSHVGFHLKFANKLNSQHAMLERERGVRLGTGRSLTEE